MGETTVVRHKKDGWKQAEIIHRVQEHICMGELPILGYHQGPQNSTIKASDKLSPARDGGR